MEEYDRVGPRYREARSEDVGVEDILGFVESFGRNISILDLGCGNGFPIAVALQDNASRYVGVDSSAVLAREFSANVPRAKTLIVSMDEMDLGGEQFDFVFAYGSVFHLPPEKQSAALRKAARAVKAGGLLVFSSATESGSCTGTVAGITVPHWSLGETAYVELLEGCGLSYQGWQTGAGDNCLFVFSRKAGNADAAG